VYELRRSHSIGSSSDTTNLSTQKTSHVTKSKFRNIVCGLAGVTSDANLLLHYAREAAQSHLFTYNEEISVELLVKRICDMCQVSTQKGGNFSMFSPFTTLFNAELIGLRPYGVSYLIAGHDPHYGFQLYHTDPSGNYGGWKAHAIGSGNAGAESILKDEYNEDLTLSGAKALAVSILDKSMDATALTKERSKPIYSNCRIY
jgi:20S proteasome subunit alpha 3